MFKSDSMDIIHTIAMKIKDTKNYCVWDYILANENQNKEYIINKNLQKRLREDLLLISEKALNDNFNILDYKLTKINGSTYSFVSENRNRIDFFVSFNEAIPKSNNYKWFNTCQEAITEERSYELPN